MAGTIRSRNAPAKPSLNVKLAVPGPATLALNVRPWAPKAIYIELELPMGMVAETLAKTGERPERTGSAVALARRLVRRRVRVPDGPGATNGSPDHVTEAGEDCSARYTLPEPGAPAAT